MCVCERERGECVRVCVRASERKCLRERLDGGGMSRIQGLGCRV
jgi:hypothetical protein